MQYTLHCYTLSSLYRNSYNILIIFQYFACVNELLHTGRFVIRFCWSDSRWFTASDKNHTHNLTLILCSNVFLKHTKLPKLREARQINKMDLYFKNKFWYCFCINIKYAYDINFSKSWKSNIRFLRVKRWTHSVNLPVPFSNLINP